MQLILTPDDVKTALKQHFKLSEDDEIVIQQDLDSEYEFKFVPRDWSERFPPHGYPNCGKVELVYRNGDSFITSELKRWAWSLSWTQHGFNTDFVKFRKVK